MHEEHRATADIYFQDLPPLEEDNLSLGILVKLGELVVLNPDGSDNHEVRALLADIFHHIVELGRKPGLELETYQFATSDELEFFPRTFKTSIATMFRAVSDYITGWENRPYKLKERPYEQQQYIRELLENWEDLCYSCGYEIPESIISSIFRIKRKDD